MIEDDEVVIPQTRVGESPLPVLLDYGTTVTWGGTDEEGDRLLAAIGVWAECEGENCSRKPEYDNTSDCGPHQMLYDQRVLDGLLMVKRSLAWWVEGEWTR